MIDYKEGDIVFGDYDLILPEKETLLSIMKEIKENGMKLSKAQLRIKLKRILDSIALGQCGWEGRESIMTFNDQPIGATVSCRNLEIGRWWPDLKAHLAEHIANELSKK